MRHEDNSTNNLVIILIILAAMSLASGCAPSIDTVAGRQGVAGPQGPAGPSGPSGQDGKIAQVVQLCPGAPSYPSVFVEVAMCINDNLYAVYSANGGFLTLLPPGAYSSNAIGSACNLTVAPHCQVSN